MMRLVQLNHLTEGRWVAVVDEPYLRVLEQHRTVYELARAAIEAGRGLADLVAEARVPGVLGYDAGYEGTARGPRVREYAPFSEGPSHWRLLPPFDHPDEPSRCLVTGTGLTHKASAEQRQAMHVSTSGAHAPGSPGKESSPVTDSMKMYQIGLEGGRPAPGTI